MGVPFEDPEKTDLRERTTAALDRAGYEVLTILKSFDVPVGSGIQGGIKGDVQGLSTTENHTCLYVVPNPKDAVPKWIANLGPIAHTLDSVSVYVVVKEYSPKFESSCRAAGLGLLLLNDDDELSEVINFDEAIPFDLDADLKELDGKTRRALETKLSFEQSSLLQRRNEINSLTIGMSPEKIDSYVKDIERAYKTWSDWAERLSAELDAAFASRNAQEMERVGGKIEAGPISEENS